MRTSFVAGFGLVLLLGCDSTSITPGDTVTPGASGGDSSKGGAATTTKSSESQSKGGSSTGKGGSSAAEKGGASNASKGGAADEGGSDQGGASDGGTTASGGKTSATGGKSSSTGGKSGSASGGKSSSGSSTGGKTGSTGGKSGAGGAATGGKTSGNPTTGGSSPKTTGDSSGGTASGGTTAAASGSGNGPAVSFKCDNLAAAAGATGQAKPSGAAGGLKVLDWAGFKGAISYTFDDSNSSQINNYSKLNDTGGKFTFYMQTAKSDASNAIWGTALKDGHELGNHSANHTTSKSDADTAQNFIKTKFGVTAYAYAAPNGTQVDSSVSGMFLTARSVAGGSMSPGDAGVLKWIPSDIASASNLAPAAGKWRTICIHGFTGGSDGAYQPIGLDSFLSAAKSAVSGGAWVTTVTNVAAYQYGQSVMKAGGTKVTWSLPAVFPSNMCVRVTTSGGTVKQGGKEVPWNDHGYYEVSLDAKEVTVE